MQPLDLPFAPPDGLRCTVCDAIVPVEGIRLLARRDDLAFLEIDCGDCRSTTLGFLLDGRPEAGRATDPRAPVSADDVLDMHQLLATWDGDLAGLLARDEHRGEPTR